ncbi:MAG: hypothetical protein PHT12_05365, partial [Patescibacteria group bacterium]|nr:hypothetical protein [Patescibacteria group bacterium]
MLPSTHPALAVACTGYTSGNPWQISSDQNNCTIQAGTYTPSTFTIDANVTVVAQGNTGSDIGVTITATTIDIEGTFTATGQGFPSQQGSGYGWYGAGYGGVGGGYNTDNQHPGPTYGSVTQPTRLGSGGRATNAAGGGAIKLSASGTLTVNGTVSSNGADINPTEGGSGGSVWLDADTLAGTGTVTANGEGCTTSTCYEGGGGGRIAVYYNTLDGGCTLFSTAGKIQAYGGRVYLPSIYNNMGGAGTIFWDDKNDSYSNGALIVDNNNYLTTYSYTTQVTTASQTYDSITVSGAAKYYIPSTFTLTGPNNYTLAGGGTTNGQIIVPSNATFDFPSGAFTLSGLDIYLYGTAGRLTNPTLSSSRLVFNPTTGSFTAGLDSLTVDNNGVFSEAGTGTVSVTTVLVKSGGKLTHEANHAAQDNKLIVSASDITIDSNGSINVNAVGYAENHGSGAGGNGGGYGGYGGCYTGGGACSTYSGAAYGSVTQPVDLGSGGADIGASGGGAVKLTVSGTLTVNGTISSNAANTTGRTGAGGSVYLDVSVGTLAGTGTISANGDDANDSYATGAGGRIAVYYDTIGDGCTLISTAGKIQAYGGNDTNDYSGKGGAGTVYLFGPTSVNGDLIIDNNNNHAHTSHANVQWEEPITPQPTTTSQTYDNLTVRNGARYDIPNGYTTTVVPTTGTLTGGGDTRPRIITENGGRINLPLGTTTLTNLDMTNNGAIGVLTNLTVSSTSKFIQNTTTGTFPNTLTDLTVDGGTFSTKTTGTFSTTNVTVKNSGVLQHELNTSNTTQDHKLIISATNIDIQNTGSVNVTGLGFPDAKGPGAGSYSGGYGGNGGGYSSANNGPAPTYGSVTQPTDIGSDHGGGAVRLTATGTLTVDGSIYANAYNDSGYTGSGGSVYLDASAGILDGDGNLYANGDDGG